MRFGVSTDGPRACGAITRSGGEDQFRRASATGRTEKDQERPELASLTQVADVVLSGSRHTLPPSTVVPEFMPRPVPTGSGRHEQLPQSPNRPCILPFAFPTMPPAWQYRGTPGALPGGSRICLILHDLRRRLSAFCRHCPPAGPTGLRRDGHWAATARTPADHVTHCY